MFHTPGISLILSLFLGNVFIFPASCLFGNNSQITTGILKSKFISVSYNHEKEKELRIAYRGKLVLETVAFQGTPYEMHFKRISDGSRIVQGVFQDGIMKECDFSTDDRMLSEFFHEFNHPNFLSKIENKGDVSSFYYNANSQQEQVDYAMLVFKRRKTLGNFKDMIKLKKDARNCHKFMKIVKKEQRRRKKMKRKDGIFEKAYFDTTESPGNHNMVGLDPFNLKQVNPEEISENVFNNNNPIILENSLDYSKNRIRPLGHNSREKSAKRGSDAHSRNKRSYINRWLMFPGTKWCGRGQIAKEYDELGDDQEADMCCREHDCCQEIIPCFTSKYNYFNYRFHALLHCNCDEKFRGCLKQSVSPMASLIGKIYFNIMGSKCFDIKEDEVCKRRSWWGTCQEYEVQKVAFIKDQEPYGYCPDE